MSTHIPLEEFRSLYNSELSKLYKNQKGKPLRLWTRERIESVKKIIEDYKPGEGRGDNSVGCKYYYISKYAVENSKLKVKGDRDSSFKSFTIIASEDYFDILWSIHVQASHCGRDKLLSLVKEKEFYIPSPLQCLLLKLCPTCDGLRKHPYSQKRSKTIEARMSVAKPTVADDYRRGFIDVIDLTSKQDENFTHLVYYQDINTKFCLLRPLATSGTASVQNIANELKNIFCDFGFPTLLHTAHRAFTAELLEYLNTLQLPDKVLNGKTLVPADYQQEFIMKLLDDWMKCNGATKWSDGVKLIQYNLNNTSNYALCMMPFKSMFGWEGSTGNKVSNVTILKKELRTLQTEEQLEEHCKLKLMSSRRSKAKSAAKSIQKQVQPTIDQPMDVILPPAQPDCILDWCWVCAEEGMLELTCSFCDGNIHKHCSTSLGNKVVCKTCFDERAPMDCDVGRVSEIGGEFTEIKMEFDNDDHQEVTSWTLDKIN